jgi:hypothetical protein|tara:strand:- start:406 stop:585 length:180 start_codon:yes stop_codon:yes gene_type:complete
MLQAGNNTLVFLANVASEPLYSPLRVNDKLDMTLPTPGSFRGYGLTITQITKPSPVYPV